MTEISSWKGHDWDLPGWWRGAANHATSYATAGGEFKKPKQIATKTGLCTTDRYLYNCRDKYLPVCTGTSDSARHPSPQGKLRTMRHCDFCSTWPPYTFLYTSEVSTGIWLRHWWMWDYPCQYSDNIMSMRWKDKPIENKGGLFLWIKQNSVGKQNFGVGNSLDRNSFYRNFSTWVMHLY